MSKQFTINPKLDFAIERFIDAPTRLVWEALTKPEHLKEWYMPKPWDVGHDAIPADEDAVVVVPRRQCVADVADAW